jgi:hypothetical protein
MDPDSHRTQVRNAWVAGSVILLVAAGVTTAGVCVQQMLEASRPSTPALFDHGLTPVNLQAPATWTNRQCGSCHEKAYRQWKASRHAVAATNKKFHAQCIQPIDGRRQWCLNCHAPTNPNGDLLPTEEPHELDSIFSDQPQWLVDGVDCLTCHVRDGKVLVTRVTSSGQAAHPVRLAPELGTAEFCGGCHQFAFKSSRYGDEFHGQLQQASMEEFLDFRRDGGGQESCHDCHMADGNHLMPGGYSNEMLNQALELDLAASWQDQPAGLNLSVSVSAEGVGHRVPGGEHFRFLTLYTNLRNANDPPSVNPLSEPEPDESPSAVKSNTVTRVTAWPRIEIMRRHLGLRERGLDPSAGERLDTRLRPGERRTFRYFVPVDALPSGSMLTVSAELRYHKMGDPDARRFGFALSEVIHTIVRTEQAIRREGADR